jgi:hypothetical protein
MRPRGHIRKQPRRIWLAEALTNVAVGCSVAVFD